MTAVGTFPLVDFLAARRRERSRAPSFFRAASWGVAAMKLRFIINPRSGRNGRHAHLADEIRGLVKERKLDADVVLTTGPGHATALAQEAASNQFDRVAAIGGDGTMNEVARALVGTSTALALVPRGSGNGLARHLRIPLHPRRAALLAASSAASIVPMDSGVADGKPFFNAMGCGFDADISRRFSELPHRGALSYAQASWGAFLARSPQTFTVRTPHRAEKIEALMVTVANSEQYGNGARIAPGARVDDRELDLVAVRPVNLLRAGLLGVRMFTGTLDGAPDVVRLKGARFIIERAAPGLIHTDGEPHAAAAAVVVEVRPLSLRVVVPTRPFSALPSP